ncbi:MAG: hypothetical protein D6740_08055 [Alphaproteobacteria bacterium]|nr:MAG: hypothetical protein D6740_08055 [Alphaproteobacteria bacterium]
MTSDPAFSDTEPTCPSLRAATRLVMLAAGLHLLAVGFHAAAHHLAEVPNTPGQIAFIVLVVILAPLWALVMTWRGLVRRAALLLGAALAGSLVFGGVFHYLLHSPDLVSAVTGHGSGLFATTSGILAVADVVGLVLSWLAWRWAGQG